MPWARSRRSALRTLLLGGAITACGPSVRRGGREDVHFRDAHLGAEGAEAAKRGLADGQKVRLKERKPAAPAPPQARPMPRYWKPSSFRLSSIRTVFSRPNFR